MDAGNRVRQGLLALWLALIILGTGYWLLREVNRQAADGELMGAREHYTRLIPLLDQQWGREAFNIKTRLEAQHFLDDPAQRHRLQAYLTAQGGSSEFPSLRVEDMRGNVVLTHEYVGHKLPRPRFLPSQEMAWAFEPSEGRLFLIYRQFVWLGQENGYLLLFKPMDNALLTRNAYPHAQLSLWWAGKPVASSEGQDGLSRAAGRGLPAVLEQQPDLLPWSLNGAWENVPILKIEVTATPLLTPGEIILPLLSGYLAFLAVGFFLLGRKAD